MKSSLRMLFALAMAGILSVAVAQAGDKGGECKDKAEKSCCACGKDKDGKECGKDKECCCKGEKEKDAKSEAPKS